MAAFPWGTLRGHFRVSLIKPCFLATGSVIPEWKYKFQIRFSVVIYFISEESMAKCVPMCLLSLYKIAVLRSPLRRCQLRLYSAFRLVRRNECKSNNAKEMEGRFLFECRILGGWVAPRLFSIQLSQVLSNLFLTPKAWKCLPLLKEEPRLKR